MMREDIPSSEEEYQQKKAVALEGALWPESFSGVLDGVAPVVPMLRFRTGDIDLSWWPKEDAECDIYWNLIGGELDNPETAEMIAVLVIEWPGIGGYRFAFDLRTNMRRLFSAIMQAGMLLRVTDAPKGTMDGDVAGLELPVCDEFFTLLLMEEHIEKRPELQKEGRNGENWSNR